MPPKRRSHKDLAGTNLYPSVDSRDGVLRFRWKDPRTGKFHGMGTDKEIAIADAKALNAIIAQSMAQARVASITAVVSDTPKLSAVILRHIELAEALVSRGKLKQSTVKAKHDLTKPLLLALGVKPIGEISVRDLAEIVNGYVDRGRERMASLVRSEAIKVWKTAMSEGWATSNLAAMTLTVKPETKRERLTLEQFKAIYAHADERTKRVMELAILTAQRRGDLIAMEFKPLEGATAWVADGMLWVIQKKGRDSDKRHVRIPLSLRLDALGLSLGEVVNRCRNRTVSKFLIHHDRNHQHIKAGDPVAAYAASAGFALAREKAGITGDNPPTLHEVRSLSLRLLHSQGVNVQALAGHKQASTTELYRDVRGAEWLEVSA